MRLRYLAQPARLRDGRRAWIRDVRADDEAAMGRFYRELSTASRYFRFMMGMREVPAETLAHFTRPLPGREGILVATPGGNLGRITAVAQFVVDEDAESAEIALVVDDAWQRQGLGSLMLGELGAFAARHGVKRIHADVLVDNHPMRRLAERTGCELRHDAATPFVLRLTRQFAAARPAHNAARAYALQAAIAGVVR